MEFLQGSSKTGREDGETCNHLLLILLSISSLLFCFPGSTTCWSTPLPWNLTVGQVCQSISSPSLCTSTLAAFPSSEIENPHVILGTAVNATLNATQVALAEATRLLSDPSTPSLYKSYIQECQGYYSRAVQELQTAVQMIADEDDIDIGSAIDSAGSDLIDCEFQYVQMDLSARAANEYDAFASWLPDDFLPLKLSDMIDNSRDILSSTQYI